MSRLHGLNFLVMLMQLCFLRYICSSGENESKSVISLFDDYLNSWVCDALSFID